METGVDPRTGDVRLWRSRQLTYGNIGDAMLSMFILASQVRTERDFSVLREPRTKHFVASGCPLVDPECGAGRGEEAQ